MNLSAYLSPHFRLGELFPDGPTPNGLEWTLARQLCERILEVLREIAGCPLQVTNGRRLQWQHYDLKQRGYGPSPTTDHAFGWGLLKQRSPGSYVGAGAVVELRESPALEFLGTGAADVLPVRPGRAWTMPEYETARERLVHDPPELLVRQLIYYPDRGHLHASNPLETILSAAAIGELALPHKRTTYIHPG